MARTFRCGRCGFETDDSAVAWDKLIAGNACPRCSAAVIGIEDRAQGVVRAVSNETSTGRVSSLIWMLTIGATGLALVYAPLLTPVPLIVVLALVLHAFLHR